jgi:hypothetical protein
MIKNSKRVETKVGFSNCIVGCHASLVWFTCQDRKDLERDTTEQDDKEVVGTKTTKRCRSKVNPQYPEVYYPHFCEFQLEIFE